MGAICNILPPAPSGRDIYYRHFVYEADLYKLEQPFVNSFFRMHLVYKGKATLCIEGSRYALAPGTLFVTFPYQSYQILDDQNCAYLYISFEGPGAEPLLRQFGISRSRMVLKRFAHVADFWMTSIRRANPNNIRVLTESVLLHTLSFIEQSEQAKEYHANPQIDAIVQYIHNNYGDPELSVSKLADIFGFSRKYLSAVFAQNMEINFTDYLTKVRIEKAMEMLEKKKCSVGELARKCGFSDPFYFSKVFKKITGVPPSRYK